MRRMPPNFPADATDEERKKARDSVITNLALFGTLVLIIRLLPFAFMNEDNLDSGRIVESVIKSGKC